jgi:hypothetical protein
MIGILDSGPKIVTSNLIAWLDAAQKRSYGGSGTTWTDISGNSNNVTFNATPIFETSNGGIFNFDNTYSATSANFAGGVGYDSWSVCLWYNANNLSGNPIYYPFSASTTSSTGIFFGGTFQTPNNQWAYFDGNIVNYNSVLVSTGTWYFLSVTWDNNTTSKTYLNAGNISTSAAGNTNNVIAYSVGQRGDGVWKTDGKISMVMLYTSVLTDSQILQNYNATKSRF